MSRFASRSLLYGILAAATGALALTSVARAVDSATIIPSAYVQGAVKSSLQVAGYKNTSMNLGTWSLNTGGNSAINFENPAFQQNKLIAFGNGGTITVQFNTPFAPTAGQMDLGIFTAQGLNLSSGALINGYMEAAILVSSDGQNWYNLSGQLITSPTSYVAQPYPLNAPTMAYDFGTDSTATSAGEGHLTTAQLAALSVANFTTPMPDDTFFNSPSSTNAQRAALTTDTSAADYTQEFSTSGGGNWFDVSGSGLSSIDYVMLNGDTMDAANGVRLENVFVNQNAALVPEPASLTLLAFGGIALLKRPRG